MRAPRLLVTSQNFRRQITFQLLIILFFLCFSVTHSYALSKEDFKKSTELNEQAIAKLKAGNLSGAESDLLQALVYSGQSAQIRKNLGSVYYEEGVQAQNAKKDFFEAQRYLSMALDIEPENKRYKKAYASSLFFEAGIRAKEGHSEEAMRLYKQAAALDPENAAAWGQASNFAWSSQNLDDAKDYLNKAQALDPNNKNVKILQERLKKSAQEQNLEVERSEHFILSADPTFMKNLGSHNALYDLEEAYNSVSYKLSYYPKNKIPVVFYPSGEFHNHWNMPTRVNAFFDGKLRVPYYDNRTPVNVLKPILMHELTHAFISTMTEKPIPQWLNEGIAQWVEGKEIDKRTKDAVMMYQTTKRLPPIPLLDRILAAQTNSYNNTEMTLAYIKSFSVVKYLIEQYGIWTLMQIVKDYHEYPSIEAVFKKFFNTDVDSLEKSWLYWFERNG